MIEDPRPDDHRSPAPCSSSPMAYDWQDTSFFKAGRIFAVPIETPQWGASAPGPIVVDLFVACSDEQSGHVACLHVTTYNGKGWKAPGIKEKYHIDLVERILSKGAKKRFLRAAAHNGWKFGKNTLIILSHLSNVDIRCVVKGIGMLDDESIEAMRELVNNIWTKHLYKMMDEVKLDPEIDALDVTQSERPLVDEFALTLAIGLVVGILGAGSAAGGDWDSTRRSW